MLQRFTHSEFKTRFRKIYTLAHAHASNQFPRYDYRHPTQAERDDFQRAIRTGWKWAQRYIIEELTYIAQWKSIAQSNLKDARKKRKHSLVNQTAAFIADIERQEVILRSLANSIVWGMYGLQRWIVRRLWTATPPVPITSINPVTATIADGINDDAESIAILADITSLVSIGDIVTLHGISGNEIPRAIEVKDGQINERLMDLIDEFGPDIDRIPTEFLNELQESTHGDAVHQAERLIRQIKRGKNYESLVNDDFGKDPVTGADMRLLGPIIEIEDYDDRLRGLLSAVSVTQSAIGVVEGCLWIGVYVSTVVHGNLLDTFLNDIIARGANPGFPVWNLSRSVEYPSMQPIFLRSLPPDSIVDITVGDTIVLLYVDWETLFALARKSGIDARWTTRQERKENTERYYHEPGFRRDGHTPVFEKGEAKIMLMGGTIGRLVYEGIMPSSLVRIFERDLNRMNLDDSEEAQGRA